MAIGFARLEFIKRSDGKNAVAKAAYNFRTSLHFESNTHSPSTTYNFSNKDKPIFCESPPLQQRDLQLNRPDTCFRRMWGVKP